jgi:hypothetical protein
MATTKHQDITGDSIVPVYVVPVTAEAKKIVAKQVLGHLPPDEIIAAQQTAKDSAHAKLKKLGLTEDEISAIII